MPKSFFYSFSNGLWLKMNSLMVTSNSFIKHGDKKKEREILPMQRYFHQIFVNLSIVCVSIHLNQLIPIRMLTGVEKNINHVSPREMKYYRRKSEGNILYMGKYLPPIYFHPFCSLCQRNLRHANFKAFFFSKTTN